TEARLSASPMMRDWALRTPLLLPAAGARLGSAAAAAGALNLSPRARTGRWPAQPPASVAAAVAAPHIVPAPLGDAVAAAAGPAGAGAGAGAGVAAVAGAGAAAGGAAGTGAAAAGGHPHLSGVAAATRTGRTAPPGPHSLLPDQETSDYPHPTPSLTVTPHTSPVTEVAIEAAPPCRSPCRGNGARMAVARGDGTTGVMVLYHLWAGPEAATAPAIHHPGITNTAPGAQNTRAATGGATATHPSASGTGHTGTAVEAAPTHVMRTGVSQSAGTVMPVPGHRRMSGHTSRGTAMSGGPADYRPSRRPTNGTAALSPGGHNKPRQAALPCRAVQSVSNCDQAPHGRQAAPTPLRRLLRPLGSPLLAPSSTTGSTLRARCQAQQHGQGRWPVGWGHCRAGWRRCPLVWMMMMMMMRGRLLPCRHRWAA
ncbi:hypothetical protein V8C86DRAFT_2533635, partial [Haematococcus lacustris]